MQMTALCNALIDLCAELCAGLNRALRFVLRIIFRRECSEKSVCVRVIQGKNGDPGVAGPSGPPGHKVSGSDYCFPRIIFTAPSFYLLLFKCLQVYFFKIKFLFNLFLH